MRIRTADSLDNIPVPHPTSITVASLNMAGLDSMKRAYETVRCVSLIMISWISCASANSSDPSWQRTVLSIRVKVVGIIVSLLLLLGNVLQ
jgi:hypothetical protein